MCCTWLAENTGRKYEAKNRHLCTIPQLCQAISLQIRHVSTIGKKLVKQQYLFHMSPQYCELRPTIAAEIVSGVWGTPATFNGFRVLLSIALVAYALTTWSITTNVVSLGYLYCVLSCSDQVSQPSLSQVKKTHLNTDEHLSTATEQWSN